MRHLRPTSRIAETGGLDVIIKQLRDDTARDPYEAAALAAGAASNYILYKRGVIPAPTSDESDD